MSVITINNLQNFSPTITAQRALNTLQGDITMLPFVRKEYSSDIGNYGDNINVGKYGQLSSNSTAPGEDVTLQNPNATSVSISLDQYEETTVAIDDKASAISRPNPLQGYMEEAMMAQIDKMESFLFSVAQGFSKTIGDSESDVDLPRINEARKILADNFAPRNNRGLFLDTNSYSNLLASNNLGFAQNYGNNQAISDGRVPRVYGFNAFESNYVPIADGAVDSIAMHQEALAMVARPLPNSGDGAVLEQFTVSRDGFPSLRVTIDYNSTKRALQLTVDSLYGASILRDELGLIVQSQV